MYRPYCPILKVAVVNKNRLCNKPPLSAIFGRPFMKRFRPYDNCLSVLYVTLVYCCQTVGRIKMTLGIGGKPRPTRHYVRWGPSSPSPHLNGAQPQFSQFSAHVCRGQTAGWIKVSVGMEVGLGPGHIVSDGDPAPHGKGHSSPHLSAHVYCDQTVTHLRYC